MLNPFYSVDFLIYKSDKLISKFRGTLLIVSFLFYFYRNSRKQTLCSVWSWSAPFAYVPKWVASLIWVVFLYRACNIEEYGGEEYENKIKKQLFNQTWGRNFKKTGHTPRAHFMYRTPRRLALHALKAERETCVWALRYDSVFLQPIKVTLMAKILIGHLLLPYQFKLKMAMLYYSVL